MAVTPVTITLYEPIVHGKETYTQLTYSRRLQGADLINMDAVQGGVRKTYALYASLADVPLPVFYKMDAEDIELAAQAVAPLTGKYSRATEESPSPE